MKVIFLDIDGVLNSFKKLSDPGLPHQAWCPDSMKERGIELEVFPKHIKRVNRIVRETGAKIILSSSWRIGYLADYADVIIYLHNMGLNGFILGRTPNSPELTTRGREIEAWFEQHPEEQVDSFVILDDSADMEPFLDKLVQTNYKKGLLDVHVRQAIEMLNE